ncbi:MAG: hypothetical protein F6J97_05025 [Leptolyngbya sp. SIO4C1]|nr:hypothetical protein [Leptolyngbya sp. SIO4C1]
MTSYLSIAVLLFWLPGAWVQHRMLPNQGAKSVGRWLGLTAAGILIGAAIIYGIVRFAFYGVRLNVLENPRQVLTLLILCALVTAVVVGVTQWLILRRRVASASAWSLAVGISGTLIWGLALYLMVSLESFIPAAQVVGFVIPLLLGSALGWLSGWAMARWGTA